MNGGNARKRREKGYMAKSNMKSHSLATDCHCCLRMILLTRLTHRFIAMIISLRTRLYSSAHFVVHIIVKLPSSYVLYLRKTSTEFPFPFGYKVKLRTLLCCAHFHS